MFRATLTYLALLATAGLATTSPLEKYAEPWPASCAAAAKSAREAKGDVKSAVAISRGEPISGLPNYHVRCQDFLPIFEVVIEANGSVSCVRVIHLTPYEPPAGMRDEVRKNVMKWRFRPATLDGKPVRSRLTITIQHKCA